MSTAFATPAQAPISVHRHADTPDRWEAALQRAHLAGVQVRQLAGSGQWIVTSASASEIAYETDGATCTCAAAMLGDDPVCLHRAALREHLSPKPDPEPPTHQAYDKDAEALRWAYNDRDRAYRDLERYTVRIERGDVLTDGEWAAFMRAQERVQDAHTRIVELNSKKALVAA
jgi:hypothetical protein